MTTVRQRVGNGVVYGAAAVIAAVSTMLTGESSAAAAESHAGRFPPAPRNIRHARPLRNAAEKTGGKPARRQAAPPREIDIPAIGVTAGLMTLGDPADSADGLSLPTPPLAKAASAAGWYQFSAVPGTTGNAVIVGHVDTYVGPAVFYHLYELHLGDAIYVTAGGSRQRFDVTSAREMPKSSFPVNQVFGRTEKHMLWLITCGGGFDYQTRHYLDNIVVSAIWVPGRGKHKNTAKKSPAKAAENRQ
jgi:LPXTG-site transpeptidase (sortase) family protein